MTEEQNERADLTELFAHFGRAAYMANVVEVELALTLLQVEFLTKVREEFVRTKGKGFDKDKYETEFDDYLEKQLGRTMGQLAGSVEKFPDFDAKLKERIKTAIARRNFLIHEYWQVNNLKLLTEEGRAEMIAELSKDAADFEKLAQDIHEATKPIRQRLGIKEAVLDERVEAQMADLMCGTFLE
jgi:hypothetical protein